MKSIHVKDDKLHAQFKAMCAERGTTMQDEVARLMAEELERWRYLDEMKEQDG